jgi:lipoprotein-anchoring transpeptidase ErfK/SrfK
VKPVRPRLVPRIIFLLIAFASCTIIKPPPRFAPDQQQPSRPPPLAVPTRVDNETFLPWAREEPSLIVIDKGCRSLYVYRYGRLMRTYPVVFGRKPGRKLYAGDQRTPTGLYMITGKAPHRRWTNFMLLDYPTEHDVHRYWQSILAGTVPRQGDGYPGVGSEIGIHGTDKETFNRVGINWTLGCISLLNADVKELYTLVPVGTLVYIKD